MKHPEHDYVYVIDAPTDYRDASLATASWWDEYVLHPGEYPVRWTNLNGSTWDPDPDVHTPGYIANVGPYFGVVVVDATRVGSYRESRLLHHVTSDYDARPIAAHVTFQMYAYEVDANSRTRIVANA